MSILLPARCAGRWAGRPTGSSTIWRWRRCRCRRSFLLDIVVQSFMLLFLIGTRAAGINRPGSRGIAGVGAFNLIRRSAFQRTPGFSWLRLEPCDDVGLGLMIKRAGGRSFFAFAQQHLTVVWYGSVCGDVQGLEKNLFGSTANYRWWLTLVNRCRDFCLGGRPDDGAVSRSNPKPGPIALTRSYRVGGALGIQLSGHD